MSKLQHLNARVAKLLTQAVYEVLEAVKDTVSEYQEKSARTQRENESLKRRVQELSEEVAQERLRFNSLSDHIAEDLLPQIQIADHPHIEHTVISRSQSFNDIQRGEQKSSLNPPTPSHAEACASQAENDTHAVKDEMETHSAQVNSFADKSGNSFSAENSGTPPSDRLAEVYLSVVKREPGTFEECSKSNSTSHEDYSSGVDLSYNSSQQTPTEDAGAPDIAEISQPTYTYSSDAISKATTDVRANIFSFDVNRMNNFQTEDVHICIVCGKTFSRVGNLRIHQRCHTGEKPYGCVQCGRRFTQAGDLKKHKRVHTGEKPYFCDHCGKSFSRRENLKRHQRIHIGERLRLQQVWREEQL